MFYEDQFVTFLALSSLEKGLFVERSELCHILLRITPGAHSYIPRRSAESILEISDPTSVRGHAICR